MQGRGTFEIDLKLEPSDLDGPGFKAGRGHGRKRFEGTLKGTSVLEMVGGGTAAQPQTAYVALEYIEGELDGKAGGFAVVHSAWPRPEGLTIDILPGTGSGALEGITGSMTIEVVDGVHRYSIDWDGC